MNIKEPYHLHPEEPTMEIAVRNIVEHHLGRTGSIVRLRTGICNEVFSVEQNGTGYIVRMNKNVKEMRGSSLFIPRFAALGIRVPNIIAEEYDTSKTGFGYQIMERLPGTDLGNVIGDLSTSHLLSIAHDVADIFLKLRIIPTNGSYGLVMDEHGGAFSNWQDWVEDDLKTSEIRANKTGFLKPIAHLVEPVHTVLARYAPYFTQVPSITYYGDIAGKNVLVDDGKFSGLVDLDALAYGDWLEAVGRIRASWYGTDYGETYTSAVMDALTLDDEQRNMVRVYSLYHRFVWMCENGFVFNANTSNVIDQNKATTDMKIVLRLLNAQILQCDMTKNLFDREPPREHVQVKFSSLEDAIALVKAFWRAMPHQEILTTPEEHDSDGWMSELTAGDRTKITRGILPADKERWIV